MDTENPSQNEAPEISTLPDDSPVAQRTQTPLRIKLRVKEPTKDPDSPGSRGGHADPEAMDEDDEEDQLIDDNDDAISVPAKRKAVTSASSKRKPKKKPLEDKLPQSPAPTPSESASTQSTPKRDKKGQDAGPKKKRPPPKIKLNVALADDAMSEGHGTVTASSPATAHQSPEPETSAEQSVQPAVEEVSLEGVPIPTYPLPSKPFPVMPPVKIPTGFTTPMPLDKIVAKVRPWRVAHREIRGIAGGRFLARCWVGSRDSDYASARAIAEAEKPPTTASAPPTKSRAKGAKGSNPLPNVPSLVPSRSSSTVPELNTSASAPLTKMRNIIEAETVAQDAESTAEAS